VCTMYSPSLLGVEATFPRPRTRAPPRGSHICRMMRRTRVVLCVHGGIRHDTQEDPALDTHALSSQVGYLRLSTARLGVKERVSAGTSSLHRAQQQQQQPAAPAARSRPSTAGPLRPGTAIRNDPTFLNSPVVGVLDEGGGGGGDGGVRRPHSTDVNDSRPFRSKWGCRKRQPAERQAEPGTPSRVPAD